MIINVDFSDLDEALRRMGAKPVSILISDPMQPLDRIDIKLEKGITILDIRDIDTKNGLLNYKGRQVLLYIQDHGGRIQMALHDGQQGNKFHVANCNTLQTMHAHGRYERYVVTNRLDGDFFITGRDSQMNRSVEGTAKLLVCQNCLKALNYKGAMHENTRQLAQRFNLGEFFSTYSSFFTHLPQRRAGDSRDEAYTKDWTQIAMRFKAGKAFKCESCDVDLKEHRNLLHAHHRNGVKSDNRSSNLVALCAACHRKQAYHGHMFVPHADMSTINQLRARQGKFRGAKWDTVLEYCDPALHGLLDACRRMGVALPEVGLDIQGSRGAVVANLELAWRSTKVGVAINNKDRDAAKTAGWCVWEMKAVLQDIETFVASTKNRKY